MTDIDAAVASAMTALDPPAVIVTAAADGRRAGCLVTFSTQCSMQPLRYLVCIARANATFGVATIAPSLGVHLPTAGTMELAQLFGGRTGDEIDKFARTGWRPWDDGTPLLDGCAWFVGRVVRRFGLGDHLGVLIEPVAVSGHSDEPSLHLRDVHEIRPGHPI